MKKLSLFLSSCSLIFAQETIHSSFSSYVESKTFKNSKQKEQGYVYGVGADVHYNHAGYKMVFEHGDTQTKQPPLPRDLKFNKLFLKYNYKFVNKLQLHFHYGKVLSDNISKTDGGAFYGFGLGYQLVKPLSVDFTHYQTYYDQFELSQNDFKIEYKFLFKDVRFKLSTTSKYITLKDVVPNDFTKNSKDNYLTTLIALHTHYKTYHFGVGTSVGSFAFGVMNDGVKIQHHAMKISKNYSLGLGKTFGDFIIRTQYIAQEATELPMKNDGVDIKTFRLIGNYKF